MKFRTTALAAATLLGASFAVAAPAHADDRMCRGTIGAVTVDGNVIVPSGATCTLAGTRVKGNVEVKSNATLTARGVHVIGNIQAENHNRLSVLPRTVGDRTVRSYVDGSIQAKQGGGGVLRSNTVNGDIQLFSNTKNVRFQVYSNRIDGNLQCKSNVPAPVGGGNIVGGNKEDQCRNF